LSDIAMEILKEIRPEPSVDLRVATFALFGMMNWIYNWYRPETDIPIEQLAENMSRLFLGGYLHEGLSIPSAAPDVSPADQQPSIWRTATTP
jgi:hypothetical protein